MQKSLLVLQMTWFWIHIFVVLEAREITLLKKIFSDEKISFFAYQLETIFFPGSSTEICNSLRLILPDKKSKSDSDKMFQ